MSNGFNLCENYYSHRDRTHQERGCLRTHSESGDKVESRTAVKTVYVRAQQSGQGAAGE